MSLYGLLQQRQSANKPIRIGIIGAGTFSSAFLNQARITPGLRVVSIADLDVEKAKQACLGVGFQVEEIGVANSPWIINDGAAKGKVMLTADADNLLQADLEVILEATGVTEAGTYHAWTALETGKHVIMATSKRMCSSVRY